MDDNRVNPMEERALTNAIERAATVASINTDLDRNELLANQLKKANIDPKFAKTASQAFNKRLTVLTFQKTADEHKADSFPLTDADVVYGLVSGDFEKKHNDFIEKAAAFKMSIDSAYEEPAMEKADSMKPVPGYEYRVSMDTFEEHLDSMMDKYAAAMHDLVSTVSKLENRIESESEEVAAIFKKAGYDYDFTTAVNLYGDKLKEAIGDKLDKSASFVPTSKFVIKPQKAVFDKVAKLISDRESLEAIKDFASDFGNGVNEFAKSAAALSEEWQLKKVAAPTSTEQALADLTNASNKFDNAMANATADGTGPARAMAAVDLLAGTGAGLSQAGIKSINDIAGAARTALGNARALYSAGNNVSISPGDLLDAAFLTKDRYRDRLLAWSDMSADPQLALYPAEQVFQATNKAMDMDTSLERPDQRELLRTQVAQLLAQNNRVSTADIAALASTLKALSSNRGNAAMEADKAVAALGDKTAPEAPELKDIVGTYGSTEGLKDLAKSADKDFDRQLSKLDKAKEDQGEASKANIKTLGENVEKARGRYFQALQKADEQAYNEKKRKADYADREKDRTHEEKLQQSRNIPLLALIQAMKDGKIPKNVNLNFGDTTNHYENRPKEKKDEKDDEQKDGSGI
jgi:hypothetical protein